ncbi:MAG: 30S ribosomal protein S21 [Hyphomicrobium sp.]
MQVLVRDNNVDQALKALKKKLQREGVFREMKLRGHFEKPSEKKAREKAEAIRRARKLARKKLQREGLLPGKPVVARGGPGGKGGPGGGRGPGGGGFGGGQGAGGGGGFGGGGFGNR